VEPEDVEPLPTAVQELLSEEDTFRLAIRAHAEVEQLVAMAIESLFVDHRTPDELKYLGFTRSLALAISLGLIPAEVKGLVKPLTDLRNDFAHTGGPVHLSPGRARQLLRACRPYLPEQIKQHLKNEPPITYLRLAAAVIYLQVADGVRVALAEREFAERAVAEARAAVLKKGALSPQQIRALLAADDE
jgi:hypothetical protein